MNDNIPTTVEELAIMIQRTMASKEDLEGFRIATREDIKELRGEMNDGFKQLRGEMNVQFHEVTNRLDYLDARVGRIEADIHELRDEVVYRHEFDDALGRIKYMERKLGIESGA